MSQTGLIRQLGQSVGSCFRTDTLREKGHNMFAIQWFDPYDAPNGRAKKDGGPRGRFATREEAENKAEYLLEGNDIPYKVVEVKEEKGA